MEINGAAINRSCRSPSSDRFSGLFTHPDFCPAAEGAADELNEAELFWTVDSSPSDGRPAAAESNCQPSGSLGFRQPEEFGIMVALQDGHSNSHRILQATTTRVDPPATVAAAKLSRCNKDEEERVREREVSASMPSYSKRSQNSAPVGGVPILSMKAIAERSREFIDDIGCEGEEFGDGDDDDDRMMVPHEIVAVKTRSTASVLEGVGRTLKGRDLRLVRDAVLRQTGFLD